MFKTPPREHDAVSRMAGGFGTIPGISRVSMADVSIWHTVRNGAPGSFQLQAETRLSRYLWLWRRQGESLSWLYEMHECSLFHGIDYFLKNADRLWGFPNMAGLRKSLPDSQAGLDRNRSLSQTSIANSRVVSVLMENKQTVASKRILDY